MSAPHQRTVCSQPVGVHAPTSTWAGHPMPCGRDSVARHPAVLDRWDGICRWHLVIYETEPFGPEDIVPLSGPRVAAGGFVHQSWCEADHLGWSCAAWRDRTST